MESAMQQGVAVHRHKSQNIVIIYPGYNGNLDGYNEKYKKIAKWLIAQNVAAVVRISNHPIDGIPYERSVKECIREAVRYALENAGDICGSDSPTIYLMGVSAGASAIAAIAYEFEEVRKVLLIAPSANAGPEDVREGLENYTGELYVVVGEHDEVVGTEFPQHLVELARQTSKKELVVVPACDHQFRGTKNGRIFSKAPMWAFAGDDIFPSADGGIELY